MSGGFCRIISRCSTQNHILRGSGHFPRCVKRQSHRCYCSRLPDSRGVDHYIEPSRATAVSYGRDGGVLVKSFLQKHSAKIAQQQEKKSTDLNSYEDSADAIQFSTSEAFDTLLARADELKYSAYSGYDVPVYRKYSVSISVIALIMWICFIREETETDYRFQMGLFSMFPMLAVDHYLKEVNTLRKAGQDTAVAEGKVKEYQELYMSFSKSAKKSSQHANDSSVVKDE